MRGNQIIFLALLEAGLAYRASAPVNWCPGCQTVLANEQVLADGTCERSGDLVVRRDLEQWFFRITAYADELLGALDGLDWPERVKVMQRKCIGRSEGAEIDLPVAGHDETIRVFTPRPDTGFGMTFVVLAPEHPLVGSVTTDEQRAEVESFVERVAGTSEIERQSSDGPLDKRGVFTGGYAVNPFTGADVPIYLADYVLMTYGTGAIMAVPAEDQRDWDFATAHGLAIVRTVEPPAGWSGEAYAGEGRRINSAWLDGSVDIAEAKARAIAWLGETGRGRGRVNYRLRDWLLSRQRYWGCPIPVVYCPTDGIVGVPVDELPVLLPDDVEFRPTGESPLRHHEGFLHTTCPICGGPATRETDTMDTFVDSSWYFQRFTDPWAVEPINLAAAERWMPVDQYIGGIEHAILHLLYARFFTRALADLGLGPPSVREPFSRLFTQGIVTMDGSKMSKSRGNLVTPAQYFDSVGADALRLFHLFVGPPGDGFDWTAQSDRLIEGCHRFLARVWRIATGAVEHSVVVEREPLAADEELENATHRLVDRVSGDFERWSYNTAVAAAMEYVNTLHRHVQDPTGARRATLDHGIDTLLTLLAPMTPHVTAELWERRHGPDDPAGRPEAEAGGARVPGGGGVHAQPWPVADPARLVTETVTLVVQVNGKLRDRLEVPAGVDETAAVAAALASPKVVDILGGVEPRRVIARPPRLVNIVT